MMPFADLYSGRRAFQQMPVVIVAAQKNGLVLRADAYFIANPRVRPDVGVLNADNQPGIIPLVVAELDVALRRSVSNYGRLPYQLGPIAYFHSGCAILYAPLASVNLPAGEGRGGGRLLKALPKDHLGIEAAVDFVIHVFDAGAGHPGGDLVHHLIRTDGDS
jgi:hypothetical protein